jgi:hypothetical protein
MPGRLADAGKPTMFSITYELTVFGQYHQIDPAKVRPVTSTPALAPYLAERAPHIVFTPAIREFSRKIVGAETNPFLIAQKLFAAVDRIPWAGALEYSTISTSVITRCTRSRGLRSTDAAVDDPAAAERHSARWRPAGFTPMATTTTCTTGAGSIYRPTAGCPWT